MPWYEVVTETYQVMEIVIEGRGPVYDVSDYAIVHARNAHQARWKMWYWLRDGGPFPGTYRWHNWYDEARDCEFHPLKGMKVTKIEDIRTAKQQAGKWYVVE